MMTVDGLVMQAVRNALAATGDIKVIDGFEGFNAADKRAVILKHVSETTQLDTATDAHKIELSCGIMEARSTGAFGDTSDWQSEQAARIHQALMTDPELDRLTIDFRHDRTVPLRVADLPGVSIVDLQFVALCQTQRDSLTALLTLQNS